MTEGERWIVVGTDGSSRGLAAVRFGAAEAHRLGTRLRVAHVLPHHVPRSEALPFSTDELDSVGRHVLAEAVREAHRAHPELDVRSWLLHGSVASELVTSARDAELLVLGRESAPVRWRVYTGAVTVMVASRAHCPVVSVPDTWQPEEQHHRSVVAGFGSEPDGPALLEHAFAAAEALDAQLTVLHAWEVPRPYRDLLKRHPHDQAWNVAALERIESLVSELRGRHPGVAVEVTVVHQQPARALQTASHDADLLVLARREAGPAVFHLGETARALLREAACPVVVVPALHQGHPAPADGAEDSAEGRATTVGGP